MRHPDHLEPRRMGKLPDRRLLRAADFDDERSADGKDVRHLGEDDAIGRKAVVAALKGCPWIVLPHLGC